MHFDKLKPSEKVGHARNECKSDKPSNEKGSANKSHLSFRYASKVILSYPVIVGLRDFHIRGVAEYI